MTVNTTADAREAAKREKDQQRIRREEEKEADHSFRLLDALKQCRTGETARMLREMAGLNSMAFGTAIRTLLKEGRCKPCEVEKNGRKYDGFQPTEEAYK